MAVRSLAPLSTLLVSVAAIHAAPFHKDDLYRRGREASRMGDFARAAAAFEDMIRAEVGRHSVQLAVVCEAETVARLVDAGDSEEGFYFLAADVGGRRCYRGLWGAYDTPEEARAAASRLPAEMRDGKSPPIAVRIAELVTVPHRPSSISQVPSTTAAPPPRKVFTDSDLTSYRKNREDEERRFGTPKPLFEETPFGAAGAKKPAAKGKPETRAGSSPRVETSERGYWTSAMSTARRTVEERREAVRQAEAGADAAAVESARRELGLAEQALEDLRKKGIERGADPSWLR